MAKADQQLIRLVWQVLLGGRRTSLRTKCKRILSLGILLAFGGIFAIFNSITQSSNTSSKEKETDQQVITTPKIEPKIQPVMASNRQSEPKQAPKSQQSEPKPEPKPKPQQPEPKQTPEPEQSEPQTAVKVDSSSGIIVKRPDSNSSTIPLADLKFLEGLAVFEDPNTGLKGYVNGDGNIVIAPQFSGAGGFYQGRAVVKNKQELWGYIDKSGNWVIAPQFCMAGRFSEGLAAVYVGGMRELNGDCVQGKWGFISTTGKMVIAPQFEQVWRFDRAKNEAAKAKVVLDGYTGYINGKGEWVD